MATNSQSETQSRVNFSAARPSADAIDVLLSVNPVVGYRSRQQRAREIEHLLGAAGYRAQITTDLEELTTLSTARYQSGQLRAVVSVGGDGTASTIRNHVPLAVPLIPLPMGTENLLGRYLGQGSEAEAVRNTLDDGVVIKLDLGLANGRYFLLMVSAGFDADVIRRLHENRRGNITRLSYLWPVIQSVHGYRYPEMELYCEAATKPGGHPLRCRSLFTFNLPLYGMGLQIAHQTVGNDGLLDVCTFERGSTMSTIRYCWHVVRGTHLRLADAGHFRCPQLRAEAVDGEDLPYQVDGDYGGMLPLDIDVLPGQLRLLVPGAAAQKLGFVVSDATQAYAAATLPLK